jgi:hypothetical protein
LDDPQGRDRHSAFDDASEIEILEWIQNQAEKFNPITQTDLIHYCQVKYSCSISRGWVNSFVLRHREDLREVKSTQQEHPRLEVPREFLDESTRCLRENVHEMKVELVFNLHEVSMSEWKDRKEKKVIVPITMDDQTIHQGASKA